MWIWSKVQTAGEAMKKWDASKAAVTRYVERPQL